MRLSIFIALGALIVAALVVLIGTGESPRIERSDPAEVETGGSVRNTDSEGLSRVYEVVDGNGSRFTPGSSHDDSTTATNVAIHTAIKVVDRATREPLLARISVGAQSRMTNPLTGGTHLEVRRGDVLHVTCPGYLPQDVSVDLASNSLGTIGLLQSKTSHIFLSDEHGAPVSGASVFALLPVQGSSGTSRTPLEIPGESNDEGSIAVPMIPHAAYFARLGSRTSALLAKSELERSPSLLLPTTPSTRIQVTTAHVDRALPTVMTAAYFTGSQRYALTLRVSGDGFVSPALPMGEAVLREPTLSWEFPAPASAVRKRLWRSSRLNLALAHPLRIGIDVAVVRVELTRIEAPTIAVVDEDTRELVQNVSFWMEMRLPQTLNVGEDEWYPVGEARRFTAAGNPVSLARYHHMFGPEKDARVGVGAPGYASRFVETSRLTPSDGPLEIELSRSTEVGTVVVQYADGRPFDRAVSIETAASAVPALVTHPDPLTGIVGPFVASGSARFAVRAADLDSVLGTLSKPEVIAPSPPRVIVPWTGEVIVRGAGGRDRSIELLSTKGMTYRGCRIENDLRFSDLPDGHYRLVTPLLKSSMQALLSAANMRGASEVELASDFPLHVEGGSTVECDLPTELDGAHVEGRISFRYGRPAEIVLNARLDGQAIPRARRLISAEVPVNADGYYSTQGIVPTPQLIDVLTFDRFGNCLNATSFPAGESVEISVAEVRVASRRGGAFAASVSTGEGLTLTRRVFADETGDGTVLWLPLGRLGFRLLEPRGSVSSQAVHLAEEDIGGVLYLE